MGRKLAANEATIDFKQEITTMGEDIDNGTINVYNPFNERHSRTMKCQEDVALRDIHVGEEILGNYLTFAAVDQWEENLKEIKDLCSGTVIGRVSEYENEDS